MQVYERRVRPESWEAWRGQVTQKWAVPFAIVEYGLEWAAYAMSNRRFLEVLENMGRFGV